MMFLITAVTLSLWARSGSKSSGTSYNATSTVYNGDGVSALYMLQSDMNAGNAGGSAAYSVNDASVTDVVGSTQWELNLLNQTARQVYLDYSQLTPVSGAAFPSASLPSGYYNASLISRCYDARGNLVSLLSIAGSNNNCMLEIYVVGQDGSDYTLQIGHTGSGPSTGTAQVTCNAVAADGSGCDDWTVTPYIAGANTDTVADLTKLASGGGTKSVVIGSYSGDTFRVHITRP